MAVTLTWQSPECQRLGPTRQRDSGQNSGRSQRVWRTRRGRFRPPVCPGRCLEPIGAGPRAERFSSARACMFTKPPPPDRTRRPQVTGIPPPPRNTCGRSACMESRDGTEEVDRKVELHRAYEEKSLRGARATENERGGGGEGGRGREGMQRAAIRGSSGSGSCSSSGRRWWLQEWSSQRCRRGFSPSGSPYPPGPPGPARPRLGRAPARCPREYCTSALYQCALVQGADSSSRPWPGPLAPPGAPPGRPLSPRAVGSVRVAVAGRARAVRRLHVGDDGEAAAVPRPRARQPAPAPPLALVPTGPGAGGTSPSIVAGARAGNALAGESG